MGAGCFRLRERLFLRDGDAQGCRLADGRSRGGCRLCAGLFFFFRVFDEISAWRMVMGGTGCDEEAFGRMPSGGPPVHAGLPTFICCKPCVGTSGLAPFRGIPDTSTGISAPVEIFDPGSSAARRLKFNRNSLSLPTLIPCRLSILKTPHPSITGIDIDQSVINRANLGPRAVDRPVPTWRMWLGLLRPEETNARVNLSLRY
jgi:hypothetical protein